jgi:hypothetical protein
MKIKEKGQQRVPCFRRRSIGSFLYRHRIALFLGCVALVLVFRVRDTPYSVLDPAQQASTTTAASSTQQKHHNDNNKTSSVGNHTKYILYYTPYWNQIDFQFGLGRQPFLDYQCPVHNCYAQPLKNVPFHPLPPPLLLANNNKSLYDAVLISANDFQYQSDMKLKISSWRHPHQRFVFVQMERQVKHIPYVPTRNEQRSIL